MTLGFLAAERLLLLAGVAGLAGAYLLSQRRRRAYAVRFTQLPLLDKVAPRRPAWRRHVPAAAFLAALTLLVVAFARPEADVQVPRERATVVVAVDTSVSMQATDVKPSRLDAAKDAAQAFLDELPDGFNIGLVSFSGSASVVVPPTTDHDAVRVAIERLQLGPATAIGDAVLVALQAVANSDAGLRDTDAGPAPARIVLLSDGTNTSGRDPSVAAQAASEAGVPVSTIAYGTLDGTVETQGQIVPVPVDGPALREVAERSGGAFYVAASGAELREVYEDIGSSIGFRTERREVTTWFVGMGLLAALAAAGASLRWFARLP